MAISNGDIPTARVPRPCKVGCLGVSLKGKLVWSGAGQPDSMRVRAVVPEQHSQHSLPALPATRARPTWINKSWGELAGSYVLVHRRPIGEADYCGNRVRPRTVLKGRDRRVTRALPSSNAATLVPCHCAPSQILWPSPQQPATTSFGVTDCSQPLTACSRPKGSLASQHICPSPLRQPSRRPRGRPAPDKLWVTNANPTRQAACRKQLASPRPRASRANRDFLPRFLALANGSGRIALQPTPTRSDL